MLVGAIGEWYAPGASPATACPATGVRAAGPGELAIDVDLPAGSWVLVSAVGGCAMGSPGRDSFGADRAAAGDWPSCTP